jgi:hypothetical protein
MGAFLIRTRGTPIFQAPMPCFLPSIRQQFHLSASRFPGWMYNDTAYFHLGTKGGDSFTRSLPVQNFTYDAASLRAALIADPNYGDAVKFVLDSTNPGTNVKYLNFNVEPLAGRHFEGYSGGIRVDTGAADMTQAKQWALDAIREWAAGHVNLGQPTPPRIPQLNSFGDLARSWARHFYYDSNGMPLANPDPDAPVTSLASTMDFLYLFSRNASSAAAADRSKMYATSNDDDWFGYSLPEIYLWVFANESALFPNLSSA